MGSWGAHRGDARGARMRVNLDRDGQSHGVVPAPGSRTSTSWARARTPRTSGGSTWTTSSSSSTSRRRAPTWGYDCAVNFASETHVDRSIADPRSFAANNVWETFNLLESARRTNDGVRIIHVATDEVYGGRWRGATGRTRLVDLDHPISSQLQKLPPLGLLPLEQIPGLLA